MDSSKHLHNTQRDTMAAHDSSSIDSLAGSAFASAGKRTPKPIRRFADEFASLGSNPTPHQASAAKGIAKYGTHRKDNGVMNALLLPTGPFGMRELAMFAYGHTIKAVDEERITSEEVLDFYRILFYNGFLTHPLVSDSRYLNDTSYEAKRVLAYYAPYLTVIADYRNSSSAHVKLPARVMQEEMGFYDPTNRYFAIVERTTADYEQLADNYDRFPIHLRRMMEEIERAALAGLKQGREATERGDDNLEEEVERGIYAYLVRTPIIVKEFSKRIMEEFLIPAIVTRTLLLGGAYEHYGI